MRLMIAPGATVSEGQAVMELETDKAVVGVIVRQWKGAGDSAEEGEKIKVGQVIFTVENHAAAVAVAAPNSAPVPSAQRPPAERASAERPVGESPAAAKPLPAPAQQSAPRSATTNTIDRCPGAS